LASFIDCITENTQPKTDGRNGLDVVRVIEAANISLLEGLGDYELAPLTYCCCESATTQSKANG
jgi:hypothetical protein